MSSVPSAVHDSPPNDQLLFIYSVDSVLCNTKENIPHVFIKVPYMGSDIDVVDIIHLLQYSALKVSLLESCLRG